MFVCKIKNIDYSNFNGLPNFDCICIYICMFYMLAYFRNSLTNMVTKNPFPGHD